MAYGFLGHFGLGKETTWGTAVTAADYVELMSENLTTAIERFETRNVSAAFNRPDDYAGARRSTGDVVAAANAVALGHFLKAALNTVSGSVVLSGYLFTTRFISTKSEFAAGVPTQPYTLEVFRDVTSSHRFVGAVCNRLQLALAPNQDMRVTAGWIAKTAALIAKSTPTFPGSPTDPFTFDTASLAIAGTATARVEALNLTIDNQLEGVLALNASNEIARIYRREPQMIRLGGTLDFADVTEYNDFINQTERAFKLTMTRASSFMFVIEAPRFVYTSFPQGMSGRGRLTVAFDGEARYLASSGTSIDLQLTSTRSNY